MTQVFNPCPLSPVPHPTPSVLVPVNLRETLLGAGSLFPNELPGGLACRTHSCPPPARMLTHPSCMATTPAAWSAFPAVSLLTTLASGYIDARPVPSPPWASPCRNQQLPFGELLHISLWERLVKPPQGHNQLLKTSTSEEQKTLPGSFKGKLEAQWQPGEGHGPLCATCPPGPPRRSLETSGSWRPPKQLSISQEIPRMKVGLTEVGSGSSLHP